VCHFCISWGLQEKGFPVLLAEHLFNRQMNIWHAAHQGPQNKPADHNPVEMMCGGRRPAAAQIQLLLRQLKSKTGREERKLPDKN
jgi:hypothetical protein